MVALTVGESQIKSSARDALNLWRRTKGEVVGQTSLPLFIGFFSVFMRILGACWRAKAFIVTQTYANKCRVTR